MTNYYLMHHPNIRTLATLGDRLPPRHQNYGTIYLWLSAMPLMLPLLNASRKPIYLGKRIAASSLFPFYCLKESDTQFFVSLLLL